MGKFSSILSKNDKNEISKISKCCDMVRGIVFISFLLCWHIGFSQTILWERSYEMPNRISLESLSSTPDGGFVFGCYADFSKYTETHNYASDNRGSDFSIFKANSIGEIQWEKTYGGSKNDYFECVKPTLDGGYILGGLTDSSDGDIKSGNKGSGDYWIVKVNSTGNIEWEKTYGGTKNDYLTVVQTTYDGGYILGGRTKSQDGDIKSGNRGEGDVWLVKVNRHGDIQWEKTYGGSNSDNILNIQPTNDGGYVFCGMTRSSDGDIKTGNKGENDAWIVKINYKGRIQWQKTYGGTSDDWFKDFQVTPDHGFILAGQTKSSDGDVKSGNKGGFDGWIVKLDTKGRIQWEKTYGGTGQDTWFCIQPSLDGDYILGGQTGSMDGNLKLLNKGANDYWIAKINSKGAVVCENTFGGSSYENLKSLQMSLDGGYILGGSSESSDGDIRLGKRKYKSWVVKIHFLEDKKNLDQGLNMSK